MYDFENETVKTPLIIGYSQTLGMAVPKLWELIGEGMVLYYASKTKHSSI